MEGKDKIEEIFDSTEIDVEEVMRNMQPDDWEHVSVYEADDYPGVICKVLPGYLTDDYIKEGSDAESSVKGAVQKQSTQKLKGATSKTKPFSQEIEDSLMDEWRRKEIEEAMKEVPPPDLKTLRELNKIRHMSPQEKQQYEDEKIKREIAEAMNETYPPKAPKQAMKGAGTSCAPQMSKSQIHAAQSKPSVKAKEKSKSQSPVSDLATTLQGYTPFSSTSVKETVKSSPVKIRSNLSVSYRNEEIESSSSDNDN